MLYLFYEGAQPIGIFDFDVASEQVLTVDDVQGGMIGKFGSASDTSSPTIPLGDGFDEYGASAGAYGNIKTTIIPATTANDVSPGVGPYCILDDGHIGYGTMFGHQFGHETGSDFKYYHAWREGKLVGPNTIAGSGKVTGWITPGIYGTDYYDTSSITDTVIQDPNNNGLTPGTPLTLSAVATLGLGGTSFITQGCYFVSFLGDPSYVSTSFNGGTVGGDTAYPVMLFMWK